MEIPTSNPTPYLMIGMILILLFGSVGYGMYLTFGSGSNGLRDTIDEHARLHELGIAHSHDKLR